jgi:cytochrome c peroxidase
MKPTSQILLQLVVVASSLTLACAAVSVSDRWSSEEKEALRSLWIGSLDSLPADPSNRFAEDPRAAELGARLFFDTRLSANGKVSCGTCHVPERDFQDGQALASGVGRTDRRTMPVAGTAYAPFLFWDGRKDSQWSQALGPLESPVEHGGTRALYAHQVARHYRTDYESIFGALPELSGVPQNAGPVPDSAAALAWSGMSEVTRDSVTEVFVNVGKAIAAYERRIQYGPSRFDRYVEGLLTQGRAPAGVLSADEVAGLRLFVGKANCTRCHDGPLFTNNEFHNTGVAARSDLPADRGRTLGAQKVLADEFNCRSRWSDALPEQCVELEFMQADGPQLERAFKAPSLRNVAERAPYMHAGQHATLAEVLAHYNRASAAPAGTSELEPLRLSARELRQLEAFLRALSGAVVVDSAGFPRSPRGEGLR